MAVVVVEEAGQVVRRSELRGTSLSIGRDEGNDICLENRALSRRHAEIEVRGASIWIRDLGSQNGTFVNGTRLAGARVIQAGDVISLGGKFELRLEEVDEAKRSTPVLTLTGPEGSHRFAMVGDEIVVGRSPECDISIGRKSISRRHVRVVLREGKFLVEDLGSQNGTKVNGTRTSGPTPITPEDEIRIAEYTLRVGYLDEETSLGSATSTRAEEKAGMRSEARSIVLDRAQRASAGDMGGDFKIQVTGQNHLRLGAANLAEDGQPELSASAFGSAEDATLAPQPPARLAPPAASAASPKSRAPVPPPIPARAAKAPRGPALEIRDQSGAVRTLPLADNVVCLGEDGAELSARSDGPVAAMGALLIVPARVGYVAAVCGDRRVLRLGSAHAMWHHLSAGDEFALGSLSLTFRDA